MKKFTFGFTLIEVMVTVAIAAIVIVVAVPSLNSLYESVRAKNNTDKIHSILVLARNQAINYGTIVNICSLQTATSCKSGTDWSKGIRVFVEGNGVTTELKVIDSFDDKDKVKGPSKAISFSSDGISTGGDFIYCPNGKADESKSISVSSSGRVSYGDEGKSC
ncbi:prepilin-type N-terminal cleavage/methylation domain-containing protein [Shewanella frigidimarina]|uniref:GspH/FimT family pseudopilin n=1 Tax=Shewanella frigidimarina TaxID=56812 RepID=UPI000F4EC74F|nr:GspH/FimT family pseudopilin [Shewanella frigidimarina]RPA63882.1 prepilin-type N-terminal cleavage/methylation domain-containing protein [Shewanella frigidimarina]